MNITLFKKDVYSFDIDELKAFLELLNKTPKQLYKEDYRDDVFDELDGYYSYYQLGKNNSINHYISGLGWVANYQYCKGKWLYYLANIKRLWEREQNEL